MRPSIQAEADELARKVDSLIGENAAIKSEIDRLSGNSQKLRLENNTLMVHPYAISLIRSCIRYVFFRYRVCYSCSNLLNW